VYVSDRYTYHVVQWMKDTKRGIIMTGGRSPQSIAFDEQSNIYVSDSLNHQVQKFCIDSNFLYLFIKINYCE
jgi:DNA-binding beta-propeller fold protein YncE